MKIVLRKTIRQVNDVKVVKSIKRKIKKESMPASKDKCRT